MQHGRETEIDVAVVGGGLAGLTAAALAARAGARVTLFEKATALGGRATTQERAGFFFNIGPHALYCGAQGMDVLRDLGIEPRGAKAPASGAFAIHRGTKHALPVGFVSLLTTALLPLPAKLEFARLFASLARLDTSPLQSLTVERGLERLARREEVRELLGAFLRLTSYTNAPALHSAGAGLDQLKGALKSGVFYIDGGWQTLVSALQERATAAGARLESGVRVERIEGSAGRWSIARGGGEPLSARAVILAIAPDEARDLLAEGEAPIVARWAEQSVPVRAACLDVALTRVPDPRARFALGIDRPLYVSLHSATAKLAPPDGGLVHVAKYLPPGESDAAADERELEGLLDLVQPGWRGAVAHRRFLPHVTVANAVVTAAGRGLPGRPGPSVPGAQGLFVAGDWVGAEGMLADASLASAREAAQRAHASLAGTRPEAAAA